MNTYPDKSEKTQATKQEFPIPGNGGDQVKAETVVQNGTTKLEDEVDEDGDAS